MKLKLSDWASIAEVTSGIAVVVTLVFLVVGIHRNTNITRASVYANNVDAINDVALEVVKDKELSRLMDALFSKRLQGLDGGERRRLSQLVAIIFRQYEKAYFSQRYNMFGESEWIDLRKQCVEIS